MLARAGVLPQCDDFPGCEQRDGKPIRGGVDREELARGLERQNELLESQSTKRSKKGVRSFQKARPISSTINPNPTDVAISRVRTESGERLMPSIV